MRCNCTGLVQVYKIGYNIHSINTINLDYPLSPSEYLSPTPNSLYIPQEQPKFTEIHSKFHHRKSNSTPTLIQHKKYLILACLKTIISIPLSLVVHPPSDFQNQQPKFPK